MPRSDPRLPRSDPRLRCPDPRLPRSEGRLWVCDERPQIIEGRMPRSEVRPRSSSLISRSPERRMPRSCPKLSLSDQRTRQPERTWAWLFSGRWVAKTAVRCALGVEQKLTKRIGQGFMGADATKRLLMVTNHFFIIFWAVAPNAAIARRGSRGPPREAPHAKRIRCGRTLF